MKEDLTVEFRTSRVRFCGGALGTETHDRFIIDHSTQIIALSTETHIQRLVTDVNFWMQPWMSLLYTFILLFSGLLFF